MKLIIKLSVTREHISKGVRKDACRCPVALAMRDAGLTDVVAGDNLFWGNPCIVADTPSEVAGFMKAFDAGKDVYPFDFEVEASLPVWTSAL